MWFSDDFTKTLTDAVAAAERGTDAELVVVVARRSGNPRDLALLAGIAGAVAMLGFILFSPWDFDPLLVPGLVAAAGVAGLVLVSLSGTVARWLTWPARRQQEVQQAADAAFFQEVVHGTRGRTGVLIYASVQERLVALRPDLGLQGRVAAAHFHGLDFGAGHGLTTPEAFVQGLRATGELLAKHVPALDDNPNEIPDAPRFRR